MSEQETGYMAKWPLRSSAGHPSKGAGFALALSLCLIALGSASQAAPKRVISLDYCADQFVLKFADRGQILALSSQSQASHSYMREAAKGLPQVRSRAESVLALKPDLVVRTYGGGPDAARFFKASGTPVLQLGQADEFEAIRSNLLLAANGLGHPGRGAAAIERFDETLALAKRQGARVEALYVTSGGVQAGSDTSLGQMMAAAGLTPYDPRHRGWSDLPLERLAAKAPRLVITGFMGLGELDIFPWSSARHPLVRQSLKSRPTVALPGAVTACSGWFIADATLAMAKGGDGLRGKRP
jgi:iron complex transport system substrate-binding protein